MSGPRAPRHAPSRHAVTGPGRQLRPQLVRAAVLPTLAAALSGAAAVIFTLQLGGGAGDRDGRLWPVLTGCALLVVGALAAALLGAQRAAKTVRDRCEALRRSSVRGRQELRAAADRLERGETPPRLVRGGPAPGGDPAGVDEFWLLSQELRGAREQAHATLVRLAGPVTPSDSERKVEVFVNLARRLQSLVHREIALLDDLEDTVEDPDLLKELFHVDHLATRIRRHAENLAVLGGAASRRQWTRPIELSEVLRSSVAEVEQYTRVKVVPPAGGSVRGHAVADVVHLLAELVENATVFSAPDTDVVLRAERVTAGIAVEVEDRGLGMPVEEQHRMNALLGDPDQISVRHLLADGRIGLFVVSALARRHGIAVELKSNIYGGVLAVLVLPQELLGAEAPSAADAAGGSRSTSWGTGEAPSIPHLEPVPVPAPWQPPPQRGPAQSGPLPPTATPSSPAPAGATPLGPVRLGAPPSGPASSGPASSGPARLGAAPSGPAPLGADPAGPASSGATPLGPVRLGATPSGPASSGPAPSGGGPAGSAPLGAALSGPASSGPARLGATSSSPASSGPARLGATSSSPASSGPARLGATSSSPASSGPARLGATSSSPASSGPARLGATSSSPASSGPARLGATSASPASSGSAPSGATPASPALAGSAPLGADPAGPAWSGATPLGPASSGPALLGATPASPASSGPAPSGPVPLGPASSGAVPLRPASSGPARRPRSGSPASSLPAPRTGSEAPADPAPRFISPSPAEAPGAPVPAPWAGAPTTAGPAPRAGAPAGPVPGTAADPWAEAPAGSRPGSATGGGPLTWLEGAPRAGVPVEPPAGPLAGPEARLWTAPEHGDGAAARGGSPTSAGPAVPSALAPTPAPSEPVAESWAGAPVLPRRASGAALPAQRAGDMGQGEPWADGPGLPGEPGDEEERPVLPRRRAQQHLAPQLREAPVPRPATDAEQPLHDPGLMAAFQRGFGLAQSENQL